MKPTAAILEQELKDARAREDEYRVRLARHRELSRKLRAQSDALRAALRTADEGPLDLDRLLEAVGRLSSQALGVPRTSVWLFDERHQNLVCRWQLPERDEGPRLAIAVASAPRYVNAIRGSGVNAVAVADVFADARTAELHDYLRRHDVGALLDIPIVGPGAVHGVVCHEHQGGTRDWHEAEIDFATDVGALVALLLEAERRREAERMARGTEAKYQNLVEKLPVVVYSFDYNTAELDYLSPRMQDLAGHPPEHYLAANGVERWSATMAPEDRPLLQHRFSPHPGAAPEPELVYRINHPEKGHRWIRDSCALIRDARGKPFAVQGTLADITELRQAELWRAEAERRYQALLENVDVLGMVMAPDGRLQFVNDGFVRATGFSREEALGADAFTLLLPAESVASFRDPFVAALSQGQVQPRMEVQIRSAAGRLVRVLWTHTLLRDPDGEVSGVCSLGVDITLRVAEENAALEEQKMESLGRLAASVAHDFNNLLMVISAEVELLDPGAEATQARAQILEAVGQARSLTRALLAYARRETIAPTLVRVDELITNSAVLFERMVGRGVTLTLVAGAKGAEVVMDPSQLRQLIANLVVNAADATRGHGNQVRLSTAVVLMEADQARAKGLASEGDFVILRVSDDGPGVTTEIADKIFDPFFTTKPDGTGLGLAMCDSIVRRAAGRIEVSNTPGQGAVFSVYLPIARWAESRKAQAPEVPPATALVPAGRRVVLVVEDVEPVRNLVVRILSEEGLDVLEAPDLATASQRLREQKIDLILADGRLPDGDGAAWAAACLSGGRVSGVVVMVSGPSIVSFAGPYAVLPKPFRLPALVETVKRVLA